MRDPVLPGQRDGASWAGARSRMVEVQLRGRDIEDSSVLRAMREVPRQEFVPPAHRDAAYDDRPLPIGDGVTISQPYIVALMLQLAGLCEGDRVLDIGTGSGYQAAVLSALGAEVYGVEVLERLATSASERLARLGYPATVRHGDGARGWPEHAPYAAILAAAAPTRVPEALCEQLRVGGRLILPVGPRYRQQLVVITRTAASWSRRDVLAVAFVPMIGVAERDPR